MFAFFLLFLFFKSLIQFLRAPIIDNPIQFVQDFQILNQPQAYPGRGTGISMIGDLVGYNKSPLFPYFTIDDYSTVVIYCDPSYRVIYVDTIWNVFFIGINPDCTWREQSHFKFYGPYRFPVSLEDL